MPKTPPRSRTRNVRVLCAPAGIDKSTVPACPVDAGGGVRRAPVMLPRVHGESVCNRCRNRRLRSGRPANSDFHMSYVQRLRLNPRRLVPQIEPDGLAEGLMQLAQRAA